jgi:hypothetical protein
MFTYMPLHSHLYGMLVSVTSSINYMTAYAPAPNGIIKRKAQYCFNFYDFEEFRDAKLCIPDGLVTNEKKGILLIPECKTALSEQNDVEPRLRHQMEVYSSKQFHDLLRKAVPYKEHELLVFTFAKSSDAMIGEIEQIKIDSNIVLWSVEENPGKDTVTIKKGFGRHIDSDLDQLLSAGIVCQPPVREFIDADMPEPRIAFVLACRLLDSYGERLLNDKMVVEPQELRTGNPDLILSDKKLRRFFRVICRLVPDLCTYDRITGSITIKKRLNSTKVQPSLAALSQMSIQDYRRALGMPLDEEAYLKQQKEIEQIGKPKRTPTLEELMK